MKRIFAARLFAGTLALTCAAGGMYIGVPGTATAALSAAVASSSSQPQATAPRQDRKETAEPRSAKSHDGAPPIVAEAASVLRMKENELIDKLKKGVSLADVAKERGMSSDDLTAKLLQLRNARIDEAVKAGKLDAAKAEKMKQNMGRHLSYMIAEKNLLDMHSMHMHKRRDFLKPDPEQLAAMLGITEAELRRQLKSGKSLTEIAAGKGIGREQLMAKLQELMTPKLERWIDRKRSAQ
ncbi:hypothetical protein ACFFK0_11950 [Paenibacillus chartarius]|uniref:LysM domain-containing protein n=1 Tax=Paenibacillus chartarius TaxID=747481 RepID=A0ABV6DKH7_9BACL